MGNIPPPLLIFIVIVVLSAIIGGLAQVLRNQQQTEQTRAANARAATRDAANQTGRDGSDIDRFLEEIDKLRKKPAGDATGPAAPPPVARKVATPVSDVPTVEPRRRPSDTARSSGQGRIEDLPVAPVVQPASKSKSPPLAKPAPAPSRAPVVQTEFGKQLMGLLAKKQSVPMAVVLHEVLGPPRCRR